MLISGLLAVACSETHVVDTDAMQPDAPATGTPLPWVRQMGGPGVDDGNGVAIDAAGNVYVVGETGYALEGQTALGQADGFIRAYDSSGTPRWTHQFGTTGDDIAWAVAATANGTTYVIGATTGPTPTSLGSDHYDAFLRCFAPDGVERWTRVFGTDAEDWPRAVAIDAEGHVVVVGNTRGALTEAPRSTGYTDAFVRTFDADGNALWTRQFGGADGTDAFGVAIDPDGSIYVTGQITGVFPGQRDMGIGDAYLRKYDADGNEVWTRQLGTTLTDHASAVGTDRAGHVCIVGDTYGAFDGMVNAGLIDGFVACYDASGTALWVRQIGGERTDMPVGIAFRPDGSAFVAGTTWAGDPSPFVRDYDPAFELTSATVPGASAWDQLRTLAVGAGRVCFVGTTLGTYPGQTSGGDFDTFVICQAE